MELPSPKQLRILDSVSPIEIQPADTRRRMRDFLRVPHIVFKDDPLAAGGFGPHDARIMVMPTPKRVMLVRPRTQFVTEMLKSVEAL